MKRILLVLILAVIGTAVDATASVVHNFEYTYEGQTLTYTVLDETAKTCSVSKNTVSGSVIIPEKASDGSTEYSVASIGSDAFDGCTGLTEITIPNSVTSIGTYAFFKCTGLTKAEFASIESLCNIYFYNSSANPLGYADHLYIEGNEITELVIPESVTSISNYAFYGCGNLKSVTIGNSVTSIRWSAFYGCSNLKSVVIGNSVTSIGFEAFYGCSGLTSVTIGESITSIDSDAFSGCSGVTSLTILTDELESWSTLPKSNLQEAVIGDNVTKIPASAFSGCKNLIEISIPESVTTIGDLAFYNCTGLTKAEFASIESLCNINFEGTYLETNPLCNAHHLYIDGEEITDIVIPESVTAIGNRTFTGCSYLTSVTIPSSVTSIGDAAFIGCSGLTKVTIPGSVSSIGYSAFSGCSDLTSVTIPASVKTIESETFFGCNSLTSVTIPNSVTSIGNHAFGNCTGLTSVTVGNLVESINANAFYGCTGFKSLIIGTAMTSVDKSIFASSPLVKVALPSTVENPFAESVVAISYDAFDSRIGDDGCLYTRNRRAIYFAHTDITDDYEIPSTVRTIKANAFACCKNITEVYLSEEISEIGENAWGNCDAITDVTYMSTEPCTAPNNIFMPKVYDYATLHVPDGMINTYMDTDPWSFFYNITDEPVLSGIDEIEDGVAKDIIDYVEPYEVYNMQGIYVGDSISDLTPGFYIIRQGSKAAKIAFN